LTNTKTFKPQTLQWPLLGPNIGASSSPKQHALTTLAYLFGIVCDKEKKGFSGASRRAGVLLVDDDDADAAPVPQHVGVEPDRDESDGQRRRKAAQDRVQTGTAGQLAPGTNVIYKLYTHTLQESKTNR
jgi:hypothetical protein